MNAPVEKILAIQFKYLGDAVFITPALRALKEYRPESELHVLVAAEVAPLLAHLPWITRVWALPRTRGRARLRDSWPLIRALRRERFTRSIDFGGNDRGAILSFLSGARQRLGAVDKNKWLHKIGYTQTVDCATLPPSWIQRHLQFLSAGQIPPPRSTHLEIVSDPRLAGEAAKLLPDGMILCHLGTSQPRKEWAPARWREFYQLARTAGYSLAFSSGPNDRERALLAALQQMEPEIFTLPKLTDLRLFLAVLARARAVIAGDTGPLHFAAGLGVPVVGLLATGDSLLKSAPIYDENQIVRGSNCFCATQFPHSDRCEVAQSCINAISAPQVLTALQSVLAAR